MGRTTNSTSKNNEQFGCVFRYRRKALLLCAALPALAAGSAYAQEKPANLPPVQVEAPKERAKPKQGATATPSAARRRTARATRAPKPNANPQTVAAPDDGNGPNNNPSGPPLQQAPGLGKTGTKLADLPSSVQIVP